MRHRIKKLASTLLALGLALWTGTGIASAQGTIKVMYTDPLSGPFAQVGDQNLQQFKYILDYINGRGGALGRKFELVSFDNKSQPSEALLALNRATRIVILTGYASIATAVQAIKLGAIEYLTKPADADAIVDAFGRHGGDATVRISSRPSGPCSTSRKRAMRGSRRSSPVMRSPSTVRRTRAGGLSPARNRLPRQPGKASPV